MANKPIAIVIGIIFLLLSLLSMGKTGLTLGKFAPLHRGHQYMIEMALREMDEVIVVVYDASEVTTLPLSVRGRWIKQLYPQVDVIEAPNGPTEVGYAERIMRMHEQYMLTLLNGRKVTHFYSSEPYGDHMSKALNAVNRIVDPGRSHIPISATAIRQDLTANKAFVDPIVYRDLIANIVFLGAPSTDKSISL